MITVKDKVSIITGSTRGIGYAIAKLFGAEGAKVVVSGRKCLVLGRSGVSDTVHTALEDLGASEIVMISQSGSDYEENIARHTDAQVIVNTTSAGMYPENGVSPIELSRFPAIEGVLDLIYHPAKTTLLLEADALGIPNLNGLYMQVAQAKQASELFQELEEAEERIDDHKPLAVPPINLEELFHQLIMSAKPFQAQFPIEGIHTHLGGRRRVIGRDNSETRLR